MRTHDFHSAIKIFIRFRSTLSNATKLKNEKTSPQSSKDPLTHSVSTRTAAYTSVPRPLVSSVIGVLAGPESGGVPPFASVYPSSRHGPTRARTAKQTSKFSYLKEPVPPSPQDLWTRALTLASKDVKRITSKMLVYFFQRGKASYRPWSPTKMDPTQSSTTAGPNSDVTAPPALDHPVLTHQVRLTLSHYTTLIHGLLLRRHYPVALSWARKLIYPFPQAPTYASSRFTHLPRTSSHLKYSRDSVHMSLDGRALSACLVVLARLGRVHEAITVLEAYSVPDVLPSSTQVAHHVDVRHVQLNSIQMNDFLLTLLRWPSKKHALPVPSTDFPLPLKPSRSNGTTEKRIKKPSEDSVRAAWPVRLTAPTRSARPDLLLRILPALYPLYGVPWDARTVCLMLQAVRMGTKMDDVSAFGLRKVIGDLFGSGTKVKDEKIPFEGEQKTWRTRSSDTMSRHNRLMENIMEVLWKTVDNDDDNKAKTNVSGKQNYKQSSLRPLEYIPFRPWNVPFSFLPSPSLSSLPPQTRASVPQSTAHTGANPRSNYPTHPFLLAREIFLRLIWEQAQTLNWSDSLDIDLHTISSPANLPESALARLLDPDGDGLGHLGGVPKWFDVLEGALKRKLGLGLEPSRMPLTVSTSSSKTSSPNTTSRSSRMVLVDEVFGYPKDSAAPKLPELTSIAFHHYILMLGLSAPEPWEFAQAGWHQRYPFEGYPPTVPLTYITPPPSHLASSTGPFSGCTSIDKVAPTTRLFGSSSTLIPGVSEIPISLSYMRALRLVPTRDTLCAAVVFWREAVGGESLIELGVRGYEKRANGEEEEEEAYTREYESWKAGVEPLGNEADTMGEYAKFCRWIREWIDEVNAGVVARGEGEESRMMMPHPHHIHRWAGIVRKMREGQGYEDDGRESSDHDGKEDED
ncbi:hypothetical protein EV360DRAFT_78759 [Lentinula raphanica]|nr:hypothetical protein EV360DRAFT_78759 [Lentinula raphanica]